MADESLWDLLKVPVAFMTGPSMVGILTIWLNNRAKRQSEAAQHGMTAAEREDARLAREREAWSKDNRELFERVEAERDRAIAERDRGIAEALREKERVAAEAVRERDARIEAQRNADHGWNLARRSFALYGAAVHALYNARQLAISLLEQQDPPRAPPSAWREFVVPDDVEDLK